MEIEKLLHQAKAICEKQLNKNWHVREWACESCPLKLDDTFYCYKEYLRKVLAYPDKIALLNEEIKENE